MGKKKSEDESAGFFSQREKCIICVECWMHKSAMSMLYYIINNIRCVIYRLYELNTR